MRSRLPWPDRPGFKGLLRSFIAIKDTSFLHFWHARYTVVQPCINLWKANYRRWRFTYVHNLTLCYFQLSSLLLIYNCELCTMCRAECKASKKVILTKDQKPKESLAFTRTSKNMLGVILVNLLHSEAILDCKKYHIFVWWGSVTLICKEFDSLFSYLCLSIQVWISDHILFDESFGK